ncbi:response regulator [Cellulophaga sp. Ld12]|uniref:response regulator n=1 Tax=Cellulophaga sp. Ld12 TaxID=3229535 RepID=UPI00386ABC02
MNLQFRKIAIADDDEDDRYIFQEAFESLNLGLELFQFKDGMELMNYLNCSLNELPNFLFLDLNMPKKNGLECLQEIRANERLKGLPISIYSTSNSDRDIQEAYALGADIYLTKPTSFNLLKNSLERLLTSSWVKEMTKPSKKEFIFNLY